MSVEITTAPAAAYGEHTKLLGWVASELQQVTLKPVIDGVVAVDATGSTADAALAATTPAGEGQWAVVTNWPGQATTTWRARKIADGSLVWAQVI